MKLKYRYAEHNVDNDDISHVVKTLRSENLTKGKKIDEFEDIVKFRFEFSHAVAVNSGTAALHLAVLMLQLEPDDEVIIPSITFVATANVVEMCGGKVVFADIETDSLLIDIDDVSKKITKKTKAVIAVDMAGQLCNYRELRKICNKNGLKLISDACHSFGINYFTPKSKPDFVCFSFHPAKNITTGEGGMVLTDDFSCYELMLLLRNQGINGYGQMIYLGYNYRMSDINAALGMSQFNKATSFILKRQKIARKYYSKLQKYSLDCSEFRYSAYHLYIIKIKRSRDDVQKYLLENGIQTQIHYIPVYDQTYYKLKYSKNLGESTNKIIVKCPNTEKIKNQILSIPLYVSLTEFDIDYISEKILEVVEVD